MDTCLVDSITSMSNQQSYILLVDDDPNNLLLLESLLALQEYKTQSATSGQTALDLAQSSQPDLILLDVMMPDMDGFEVCNTLRQQEHLKTVPIIFLTALDDDESQIQGMEMMADDYITKPFNSQLLLAKVKNILRLNQMRSQTIQTQTRQTVQAQTKQETSTALQRNEEFSKKITSFVPTQFLKRIAPNGIESIQLGKKIEVELSILFCDIRKFTAITESQDSSQTFEWLNYFLNQMSSCITQHHGFIDKYLGDAILAIFDRQDIHFLDAIQAAIAMQNASKEMNLNSDFMDLKTLKMGIGIDTGIATIGILGTSKRMETTVIGDVVNTASRLEELTKTYQCEIIASESTISRLSPVNRSMVKSDKNIGFNYHLIDRVIPRNKQKAIDIYQVMSGYDERISNQ
jgi:two-component system sensor histidine kinase ChiS